MQAAVGIDFGTTNSTVCFFDGSSFHYADLEDGNQTIPSLMYVDRQYYPRYGELARSNFLRDNLNRRIKLEKTELGYIEIALGDNAYESFDHTGFNPGATTYDAMVSAFTDQNAPGFLFASTKRLLGQSVISAVKTFEKNLRLEAIVSSQIRNIHTKAKQRYPLLSIPHTCVGRPVNYECDAAHEQSECNALAISRMSKALEYAGIREYSYFLEPVAPVLSHLSQNHEEQNQDILVLDFGGGTLDFSLLKKTDKQLQVLGNFGRPLGGDIITEQLIRDHILPRMGMSADNLTRLKNQHNYLEDLIPDILNWRTTYMLNQPKYFMQVDEAIRVLPEEAENLNRIRLLIVQNYSYNLFYAAETAKKRLTEFRETRIDMPPIGIDFTITQRDLEESLHDYLAQVESSIYSFCAEHGYETTRVGRVLLAGGASLIPCIRRRMERLFPGKVVAIDPFLSIVNGFALGAWLEGHKKITHQDNQIHIDIG
jgi:hypothetical chaperone protein